MIRVARRIAADSIPSTLREREQWVVWKQVLRNGEMTKIPFMPDGTPAESNNPQTWSPFSAAFAAYEQGNDYDGPGYVFSEDDPFVGFDLDGCRDPETGTMADWAREIVLDMNTYTEVSPSETGVKLFGIAEWPRATGKNKKLKGLPRVCDKVPGVEGYGRLRFFAMTGQKLRGMPSEPQPCQEKLNALCDRFWPTEQPTLPRVKANDFGSMKAVVERARKYLAKIPIAVSGNGGHSATFYAACILVLGFDLVRDQALCLLKEWNEACQPPWSERELEHKIDDAGKQPGERGYLRDAKPEQWNDIAVPNYETPAAAPNAKRRTTLADAGEAYIARLRTGKEELVRTGLPDLDHALGGGVEAGEVVIVAARPSMGKSAVALQCVHNWNADGIPTLMISEEMSAIALGKRTLLYASQIPQREWRQSVDELEVDFGQFMGERSDCIVVESCGTVAAAVAEIERAVEEDGVRAVAVDYAQLLGSPGKSRYEQVTNTSIALRQCASKHKVVMLVLCQLSRDIEERSAYQPKLSDLKESGQLEQDADVIIFPVWPWKVQPEKFQPHEYKFYIGKNRNREILANPVSCRFDANRQMMTALAVQDLPNYRSEFEDARIG